MRHGSGKKFAECRYPGNLHSRPGWRHSARARSRGPGPALRGWACYHTDLYEFDHAGARFGIIGCAVGASFTVLLADQLFVSGCRFLISVTSAGQIVPQGPPPYFVVPDRALHDEGTLPSKWKQQPSTHCTTAPQADAVLRPNRMAMIEGDFEKGEADGSAASLAVIATAASAWRGLAARPTGSA